MKDYNEELTYKKRKKHLTLILCVVLFLATALIAGGAYLFFFTDTFYFTHLELKGAKDLKGSDLFPKDKISFFDRTVIINPLIETIVVHRNYFSKTLSVEIEERKPYGIWCEAVSPTVLVQPPIQSTTSIESASGSTSSAGLETMETMIVDGNCFWFDKNGVAFAKAPEVEGVLLREVDDVSGKKLNVGDYILSETQLAMLFKVFNFVDTLGIVVRRFSVEPSNKEEMTAFTEAGPPIYFSLRLDPAFAIEPFRASIASKLSTLQYLDLRSENKIFYK